MPHKLIIGDIQGCYKELQDLLDRAALSSEDEIIAVGDLVDRGPDSPAVLDFFRNTKNARSVMGNHERKNVRSYHGETYAALSQLITRRQFGEEHFPTAIEFMSGLPLFLDLPEALVLHAFYEPGVPLHLQKEHVLVGVVSGEQYINRNYSQPWQELYDGEKPLIVGHHDYSKKGVPLIFRDLVYCIDTGCCFGRSLTGLLLPEFRLISVSARRDYWSEMKKRHADLRFLQVPDSSLSWEALIEILWERNEPMPEERRARLEQMLAEGEEALSLIFDYVDRKNRDILQQLESESSYSQLPVPEQGKIYARALGSTPLAPIFYWARKGNLSIDSLRRRFKKPSEAVDLASRANLRNMS